MIFALAPGEVIALVLVALLLLSATAIMLSKEGW